MSKALELAKLHAAQCRRLIAEVTPKAEDTTALAKPKVKRSRPRPKAKPKPDVPNGMKRCTACGKIKTMDEFYDHPLGRDHKRSMCKVCYLDRVRLYSKRKREEKKLKKENNDINRKDS